MNNNGSESGREREIIERMNPTDERGLEEMDHCCVDCFHSKRMMMNDEEIGS
jgi:hypothetical protein